MGSREFRLLLGQLGLSQLEAARLLGVKSRTIQRWAAGNPPVGEPAAQALRAWHRLAMHGLAWRPDSDPIDIEDLGVVARRRQRAIGLDGIVKRVAAPGRAKEALANQLEAASGLGRADFRHVQFAGRWRFLSLQLSPPGQSAKSRQRRRSDRGGNRLVCRSGRCGWAELGKWGRRSG